MTDPPPTPGVSAVLTAASQPVDDFAPGLCLDERFSFRFADAAGFRMSFHWPPEIEREMRPGSEGGGLISFGAPERGDDWVWISRIGIVYVDVEGASAAGVVLGPWIPLALAASDEIDDVQELHAEPFADSSLWSLRSRGTPGSPRPWRADIGWRRGRTVCCVSVFGNEDVSDVATASAHQMDARLAELLDG